MTALVPLLVAIPLIVAALLVAAAQRIHPLAANVTAAAVAATVTVLAVLLIFRTSHAPIDYWFGGWHPRHGIAIGIAFHVEPLGAGVAAATGALATAALLFSLEYFAEHVQPYFHALMLIFLAAMIGFSLSGDLFNMFVFFELMSIIGFGLTGYRIERRSVLQGALNFGVTNTIAAFLIMFGIGLLYGRTGALNLQQIGETLRHRQPDGLVVVAFTVLAVGFLVKAGAFPFHFWLSDAYAVAPIPVCVLFSGVMSDLGLHGLARVYWDAFSGTLGGHDEAVKGVLLVVGCLSALVGAGMAFLQASLKRMMAFVTIAHIGAGLIGIALLSARGLAGATVYMVADGLVRGALFLAVGVIMYGLGNPNELRVFGRGRGMPVAAIVLLVGAVTTAAVPPFGPFVGRTLISQSAPGIVTAVLVVSGALGAAALLRASARIFLGLGDRRDPLLVAPPTGEDEDEGEERPIGLGLLLRLPAILLLAAGLGLAFAPGLADRAVQHAAQVENAHAVALHTLRAAKPPPLPSLSQHVTTASVAYGVLSGVLALGLAAFGLYRRRLRLPGGRFAAPLLAGAKAVHDGVPGEYVAWLTFGAAAIGAALALLIR